MKQLFTAHPRGVRESYWQHMASAFSFGLRMCIAGLACMVHALLPFAFTATGRNTINKLHEQMITHRVRGETGARVQQDSPTQLKSACQ